MGNRADVFSKAGDSITAAPHFLNPIGDGLYNLGDYQYLQAVIDHFSATEARDGNYSFNNLSLTAGVGWPAHAAIDSKFADPSLCDTGESPLAGVTYTLRGGADDAIGLQAAVDGDADEVFWFAGDTFVGRARRGASPREPRAGGPRARPRARESAAGPPP